jgi:NAD(P)H-dependent flavin oxidoreductase YrpB (nitropropane dioxygenase family)
MYYSINRAKCGDAPQNDTMKTSLCDLLGIGIPIIQAPMAGGVGPTIAAAVSNAGGLGGLAPWLSELAALRQLIRDTKALTSRPFLVGSGANGEVGPH